MEGQQQLLGPLQQHIRGGIEDWGWGGVLRVPSLVINTRGEGGAGCGLCLRSHYGVIYIAFRRLLSSINFYEYSLVITV